MMAMIASIPKVWPGVLRDPIVSRAGWALLHSLWQGVAVALVLAGLLWLLRRRSPNARYLAACGALVAMLVLPAATMISLSGPPDAGSQVPKAGPVAAAAKPVAGASAAARGASREHAVALPGVERRAEPLAAGAARGDAHAGPAPAAAATAGASWRQRATELVQPLLPWAVCAWLAGVLGLSLWHVWGWLRVRRLRAIGTEPVGPAVLERFAELQHRLNSRRTVRVLASVLVRVPTVLGWLRPVVLLPVSALTGLTGEQVEAILAHELAHVRRYDYLVNLLQVAAETLLFYHPAVWWVSRRIRAERENCCDDVAVGVCSRPVAYARALTALAKLSLPRPRLAVAANGGTLLARVGRVVHRPQEDPDCRAGWLAGTVTLLLVLAMAIGAGISSAGGEARAAADRKGAEGRAGSAGLSASASDASAGRRLFELRVVDEKTNQPIADLPLAVSIEDKKLDARTDQNGLARIPLPEKDPGYFGIRLRRDGYVPMRLQWRSARAPDPIPAGYTLRLARGTAIGGVIHDEQGRPIRGVKVSLLVPSDRTPGRHERPDIWDHAVETDQNGRWRCDIMPADLKDVWIRLSHEDYQSDNTYGATPKPPMARLRDMTGVMLMKKGLALAGRVTDTGGKPIAGASVAQGSDRWGSHYPDTVTDKLGRYRFENAKSGVTVLTVQAKGYAPDLKVVPLGPKTGSVDFQLAAGATIRGRIVDQGGKCVAGAFVAADTWRGHRSIHWRVGSDPKGRFQWTDAPRDEVLFDMGKLGYMSVRRRAMTARDEEYVITMHRPLKVSGTVVDAETGRAIPSFRILRGIDWGRGEQPHWDRRNVQLGRDGRYELAIGEPRPGHYVRIEADGYAPAVSRMFKDHEGEQTFDFRLEKAGDLAGVVYQPDGKPAARATVALATPSAGAYIRNGLDFGTSNCQTVTTKADGRYVFPPQDGKWKLVAAHEQGYAELDQAAWQKSPDIRLKPWGRVEGALRIASRPGANEKVSLHFTDSPEQGEPRIFHDVQTVTDEGGRFVLEHVPPGEASIGRSVQVGQDAWATVQSERVEIVPGKIIRVQLGGKGRPVVGRITLPPDRKDISFAYGQTSLYTKIDLPKPPELERPENWDQMSPEQRAQWYEKARKLPAVQAYEQASAEASKRRKYFAFMIQSDGSFRIEDIPAGRYVLMVGVAEPPKGGTCGFGEIIGSVSHELTIPEMPGGRSDEPLVLPDLALKLHKRLNVGDAAAAFEVKTLDGKTLKLADFRGRYVLLDFWATWCGPCVGETPHLKAVYEAFGKDKRFAMISLSLDQDVQAPMKYVRKNGMTWHQGFLGEWSKTDVPDDYGVQGVPAILLIGPDGKVLAKDLRGLAIQAAVADALKGAP